MNDDLSESVPRTVSRHLATAADATAASFAGLEERLRGLLARSMQWLQEHPDALEVAVGCHGVVASALSHLGGPVATPRDAAVRLARGLAANMTAAARPQFLPAFSSWADEAGSLWDVPPGTDPLKPHVSTAAAAADGVVMTEALRSNLAALAPWLAAGSHFLVCGRRGSGKSTVIRTALSAMPDVAVAEMACSAQTLSEHVVQKLVQVRGRL